MTTTAPSTVAVVDPTLSDAERYALAAFLAGYRGLTRDAYALDLRQFMAWCEERALRLFAVRRADIECFARDLEALGRARATVARRLCTVSGFFRYAEQEALLERHPLRMSAVPASTTSPTPPAWTATRSARCSSAPGWPQPASTRSCRCWPSTVFGSPKHSTPTSKPSASSAATAP